MPQKRLAVLPSEILHLERECENCRATTTMPFVEAKIDFAADFARAVIERCPWCNHSVEASLTAKTKVFLNALCDLRTAKGHSVRLVLQDGDRKD